MSYTYTGYHLRQNDYLPPCTATEWQQPPTLTPDYVEWQYLQQSHAQGHAAHQHDFHQPQPPYVGSESYGPLQTTQFGYYPYQPHPDQPPDPLDWHQPYLPIYQQQQPQVSPPTCWDATTSHDTSLRTPAHQPRDPVTPDLEPTPSLAALVLQLERLTTTVKELVSRMDANEHRPLPHAESRPWSLNPALQTAPPFLEQQPAVVTDWHQPSLFSATTISPSCNPELRYDSPELIADAADESENPCPTTAIDRLPDRDQVGVEGVLFDVEDKDGFLTASSLSPICKIQERCFRARSVALKCISTGLDNWATIYISDVKAIMIYCPRRLRMLGIIGVHKVDAGAINALAKHHQIWTEIGSFDCRKLGKTSLGNISFPLTSWLGAPIVFSDCQIYCVFDPGGLADEGAIMGIGEEIFRLSGMELVDWIVLVRQRALCASIKDICLKNGYIEKMKKVTISFNDVKVSFYHVVEDGCVKQGGDISPKSLLLTLFVVSWFPP